MNQAAFRAGVWSVVMRCVVALAAAPFATVAASPEAHAQSTARVPRLGLLIPAPSQAPPLPSISAFQQRLEELGYADKRNLAIERLFSEERPERFPELAAALAQSKPDVIVAVSTPAALAAKRATQTIWNSADPGMALRAREIERASQALAVTMEPWSVRSPADFDAAFATIAKKPPDAMLVVAEILTVTYRKRVLEFAATNRIPAMYEFGLFAKDGGLMAYGPDLLDVFRRGADHVDKVLKGAKPADIPVEQPAKVGLVVNLKTAKALGLTLPQSLLIRAEEVIR